MLRMTIMFVRCVRATTRLGTIGPRSRSFCRSTVVSGAVVSVSVCVRAPFVFVYVWLCMCGVRVACSCVCVCARGRARAYYTSCVRRASGANLVVGIRTQIGRNSLGSSSRRRGREKTRRKAEKTSRGRDRATFCAPDRRRKRAAMRPTTAPRPITPGRCTVNTVTFYYRSGRLLCVLVPGGRVGRARPTANRGHLGLVRNIWLRFSTPPHTVSRDISSTSALVVVVVVVISRFFIIIIIYSLFFLRLTCDNRSIFYRRPP